MYDILLPSKHLQISFTASFLFEVYSIRGFTVLIKVVTESVMAPSFISSRFRGLCYPNEMKLTWKSFEDLSTISVDKGMVEDHLPTSVMAGLKRIKVQYIGHRYDPKETERIRIDAHEKYRQRATALRRRKYTAGESFEGGDDGSSGTVDVAVTLEEERPNGDSSGHRPQGAKAQALGKPKATHTTFFGQPEEIALEMVTR